MTLFISEINYFNSTGQVLPERAQDLYRKAMEFADQSEPASETQIQEMKAYIEEAIQLDPTYPGLYIARAIINLNSIDMENMFQVFDINREIALVDLSKAIELNPNFSDEYVEAGEAQAYRGTIRYVNQMAAMMNGKTLSREEIEAAYDDLNAATLLGFSEAEEMLEGLQMLAALLNGK